MRCIVVGLGVQGHKRVQFAGDDCVATIDPTVATADFQSIEAMSLDAYDAALLCTPDSCKEEYIRYLLVNGKHVLVEKPLFFEAHETYTELAALASSKQCALYTAYNHRFEPHLATVKDIIASQKLGRLYSLRMFYGNGTAADVHASDWRDQGMGVLADIGSHLLDTLLFFFGDTVRVESCRALDTFENRACDRAIFSASADRVKIECETTLLSWRNTFRLDLLAEKGSVHIDCLCKWGPSILIERTRVLPSGRPTEKQEILSCQDTNWQAEYGHFLQACNDGVSNIENDMRIQTMLNQLYNQAV